MLKWFYVVMLSFTLHAAAQTGGAGHDHMPMSGGGHPTQESMHDHAMTGGAEESAENAADALNTVAVGDYLMSVDPLVTPEGVTLGLKLDTGTEDAPAEISGLDLSVTGPQGEMQALEPAITSDTLATVTLPGFAEGVWRVEGTLNGQEVNFPMSLYQQTTPEGVTVYLALVPAPSLSARGLAEVYAYAFEDGAFVHGDYALQYNMTGMSHATDEAVVTLEHTHFDNTLKSAGIEGSANHAPLSFAMAGTWNVGVAITHEGETHEAAFDVTVLDE